jgi:2-polyprenyl-3-methyl-5-hydroxy-6-metoxy-1,4-benzoquinol methylase
MFRVPKDSPNSDRNFYDEAYWAHFITEMPDDDELQRLKQIAFSDNERDFAIYLKILNAVGLQRGQILFDFGASWGYLSWLAAKAGYRVYSYEPSRVRARYAAEKLDCNMVSVPEQIPEKADCFFSAHVIEHLPNPRTLWQAAREVLKPDGVVVVLMPNGDPAREKESESYHSAWGQVHPLLLSGEALEIMAREHGFVSRIFSAPYNYAHIAQGISNPLTGWELLCVARRPKR